MEPKFQSSFIPKGPLATSGTIAKAQRSEKSFFGFLSLLVFILAVVASAGIFGYNRFLDYRISQMGGDLEAARASIDPQSIQELARLDARINSTKALLSQHTVLTPLLDLLEASTVRTVRFTELNYTSSKDGLALNMKGQARGYSAVALQSDVFNRNKSFKNPSFSDLSLDESGNVTFSFKATIDPSLLSYQKEIEKRIVPTILPSVSTSTATTTRSSTATTTRPVTATSTSTSTPR